jgi:hypothetical protein
MLKRALFGVRGGVLLLAAVALGGGGFPVGRRVRIAW